VCKPRVRFERRTREERSYHPEAAASSDTCDDLVEDQSYSERCRREYGEDTSPEGPREGSNPSGRQYAKHPWLAVRRPECTHLGYESTVKNMLLRIDGRMDAPLMVGDFCAWLGNRSPCRSSWSSHGRPEDVCQAAWPDHSLAEHRKRNHGYFTLSISQNRNATSVPAHPQNSPMAFALPYLYVVPPPSIARRTMIAVRRRL
jgi:hypothetical protein